MSDIIPENAPQKHCPKCGQTRPLTFFYHDKSTRSGLHYWCKECSKRTFSHTSSAPEGMKMCTQCKQCKPATDKHFYPDRRSKDGFSLFCKICRPRQERAFICDAHKKCKKCGKEKPATPEYFWVNRDKSDGLHSFCIACGLRSKPKEPVVAGYKRCYKCKQAKPVTPEFFSRNRRAGDGLQAACRSCSGRLNPSRPFCDIPGYKPCYKCRQNFPATLEYFPSAPEISSGLDSYCRDCRKQINALQTRKRRANKKAVGGKHTLQDIQDQYKRQKGKCYYCSNPVEWGKHHVDHVIPLTRGGSNDPSNLVIACPTCNLHKNNKLPHEWPEGNRLL